MSDEIFLVGNSWSIPSNEAPIPAFNLLGLKKPMGSSWNHFRCTSRIHH